MTTAEIVETEYLARYQTPNASRDEQTSDATSPDSFQLKDAVDRLLALVLLIPALPLIGLLIAAIRATSPGPGVFSQIRVGRGGRIFTMYKLRSMRIDAEAATGPVWANVARDPRVTPLGYWLRRLHLDELPQLFNVLCGDMALVGPRPERPEFVSVLSDQIPGYLERISVRPGITGLAQVNLPPDTDLDSVKRKLVLDCEYINTASLWLDFRIIACTILRVLGLRGGLTVRLLGLARHVRLPEGASPIGGFDAAAPATPHTIRTTDAESDYDFSGPHRRASAYSEATEQSL